MNLVIGGAFQGKRAYTSRTFCLEQPEWMDGKNCELEELFTGRAIYDFHEYLRRGLEAEWLTDDFVEQLIQKNPDILIVSNEIGYGIVPVTAVEREYREMVGRICTALAAKAQEVHRVTCGIGMVIKHG